MKHYSHIGVRDYNSGDFFKENRSFFTLGMFVLFLGYYFVHFLY